MLQTPGLVQQRHHHSSVGVGFCSALSFVPCAIFPIKYFFPSILIIRIPHHIFKNYFSLLSLQDILIPMSCRSLKQQMKEFLYMLIIMSISYYLPLYLQAVIYRKFRFFFYEDVHIYFHVLIFYLYLLKHLHDLPFSTFKLWYYY